MQRNIKVLIVEPNRLPKEKIIANTIKEKQKIIDGLVEYTFLKEDPNVIIIFDKGAKKLGKPINRNIDNEIILGTFIIAGDNDSGEDRSLTTEQVKRYEEKFNIESIIETNKKVQRMKAENIIEI